MRNILSTLTKPISLSILIGAYVVDGHTTCYDELAKTEVKVSCDKPRVEPTVQLRCIHDNESEYPPQIGVFGNPKWICAHYQDKQLEGITSVRFKSGWYVSIDKRLCNGLQVPPEGCVTSTTPCRHLSPTEVNASPSELNEFYQLTDGATEKDRTVTIINQQGEEATEDDRTFSIRSEEGEEDTDRTFTSRSEEGEEATEEDGTSTIRSEEGEELATFILDPKHEIQLKRLHSAGTKCTIHFTDRRSGNEYDAEISSRNFKIEPIQHEKRRRQ